MDISRDDRDVHLGAVIKSNLVSNGLSVADIESITKNMLADIQDVLNNYEILVSTNEIWNMDEEIEEFKNVD